MAKKTAVPNVIEGEDYIILTPKRNIINILPWNIRIVSRLDHDIHIDFRHTNLMTKLLIISDTTQEEEEKIDMDVQEEEKIQARIGKEI